MNQKLIIFHKHIKIMWAWWFIYFTTCFCNSVILCIYSLTSKGQRLLSESLIKKPWLLLIVMFPPYLVFFSWKEFAHRALWFLQICQVPVSNNSQNVLRLRPPRKQYLNRIIHNIMVSGKGAWWLRFLMALLTWEISSFLLHNPCVSLFFFLEWY